MLSVEKTLKQEIEQWKHEYEVLDACCELAQGKIAELKAENERLKEENYGLNQELLGYKKGMQASEIIELKQTLQEIKKICKNSHTSASEDYYRTADKILQEINEVIGAEE